MIMLHLATKLFKNLKKYTKVLYLQLPIYLLTITKRVRILTIPQLGILGLVIYPLHQQASPKNLKYFSIQFKPKITLAIYQKIR